MLRKSKLRSVNLFMKYMELSRRVYQRMVQFTRPPIKESIFFLHQPKCGGTSIDYAIRRYYRNSEICQLDNTACIKAADILGRDLDDYRRDLLQYYLLKNRIRYLSGHFAYSKKSYNECQQRWHFVTVLRNPVDRWISHYFYNKSHKNAHYGITEEISTFIESKRALMLGCLYVRNLTEGINWDDYHKVDKEKAVKMAIKAIDNFSLVGCMEHYDILSSEFRQLFGVNLKIPKLNINPIAKTQQRHEITDEVRKRIEELCVLDMEVYKYALKGIGKE